MAELVRLQDVTCVAATDRAILCEIEGEKFWIPLSQVHDDSSVYELDDVGELVITEWIALEKNLV